MPSPLERLDRLIDRLPLSPRLVRFGLVGGSGVGVNLAVLTLVRLALAPELEPWRGRWAMAAGIVVSIFSNFLLNDLWTWGDRSKGGAGQWFARLGRFYLVSAAAALLQWGVGIGLAEQLGVQIHLAQILGIGVAMGINFAANHLWTFREKRGEPSAALATPSEPGRPDDSAPQGR